MSFSECAHKPTAAELASLTDAAVRVAERSLFAFAESAPADGVDAATPEGWYAATVRFAGPFDGRVALHVPVVLARELCASFLGSPGDVGDDLPVRDLVGEFANMTCGAWLTTIEASECFNLAHPDVGHVEQAAPPDLVVLINDVPVLLDIDLDRTVA